MPYLIRHIKPDFDTPAIDCHWWRFIQFDDSRYCLAVRSEDTWYNKFDVKSGFSRGQLVKSEGTNPCPWHEFRWESNILTDRDPQPKTALERNPDGTPQQYSEVRIAREKDHKADLTTILCRHTHQRLCAFQLVSAKGKIEDWSTIYWKILPVKGKSMPTFKLLGMYPQDVRQWKDGRGGINLGELYIKQSTVYYLEDNGTSQDDF